MRAIINLIIAGLLVLPLVSCNHDSENQESVNRDNLLGKRDIAVMLASLPLGEEQVGEVYDAVSSSSGNGFDEEYMMADLLTSPGAGVGDDAGTRTKAAAKYGRPIKDMLSDYLASTKGTISKSASDVQAYLDELQSSGLQIYWPYSEEWDGTTLPLITFDPGGAAESNYAYVINDENGRYVVKDSVYVDENVAKQRPVWVINANDDSSSIPIESYLKSGSMLAVNGARAELSADSSEEQKCLYMKDFTMLRNYDPWFAGASEFHIHAGFINGAGAITEETLKNYNPELTDFVMVVKRSELNEKKTYNLVLVSDYSEVLDKIAFLINEEDYGDYTSWKGSVELKLKSKVYGMSVDIPIRNGDDIVWRGQLSASYLSSKSGISGRFGDVAITFVLK